jgi:uncharacterized protein
MNTFNMLHHRKNEILAIAARHGADNVRVFGSVARGEDTDDSDIDLLVSMGEHRTLYDLIGFKQDVEQLLNRKADVLTENALHHHIKNNVLNEAKPL